ncbi:MAG: ATP synthase F1 subunit delta [Sandaracinaceae bacterium]|jgi:F-type H+-transporting ATPase subunit delta|nr:ATP synthase F1 subunit delta [Sandaracinaceae bacterium]
MSSIGKRYARAILDLASADKSEDRVGKELTELSKMWTENANLRVVFENPQITPVQRKAVLNELVAKAAFSPVTRNLLMVLVDNLRVSDIADIARVYQTIAAERGGSVKAEVTTATALPEAYYAELTRTLESVTGKKVQIERKLDPSLIAGVVTRVGDTVFDGSLKNRLGELKDELLGV